MRRKFDQSIFGFFAALAMACSNKGCASHPVNHAFSAGKGKASNHSGLTAANWRTNGKMPMSAAQGVAPPSWRCSLSCTSKRSKSTARAWLA